MLGWISEWNNCEMGPVTGKVEATWVFSREWIIIFPVEVAVATWRVEGI